MPKFIASFTKFGTATIEAETEEEALELFQNLDDDEIEPAQLFEEWTLLEESIEKE